jgi:hypothetical protein
MGKVHRENKTKIPVGAEIFRTRPDQTGPEAHAASLLYNAYRISFPGVKAAGALTANPQLAPRLKKEYSNYSTLLLGLHGLFCGELYFYCRRK